VWTSPLYTDCGGVSQQLAVAYAIRLQCTAFLHVHRSIACLIASCVIPMGVNHGGGRGDESPQNLQWGGGRLYRLSPPDFCRFSKFQALAMDSSPQISTQVYATGYTGISAAADMAADRTKATAAPSRAIYGSGVRWAARSAQAKTNS
jgi:hypothetical protein